MIFPTVETQNDKLEIENRVLAAENSQLNDANISVSQSNMLNKMQLEKEISQREQLYEANQRHKERYKMLMDRYNEQSEKMKTMEHSLRSAASTKRINHVPVEIIGMKWFVTSTCLKYERAFFFIRIGIFFLSKSC